MAAYITQPRRQTSNPTTPGDSPLWTRGPTMGLCDKTRSLPEWCGDQLGEGADRRVPLRISEFSCARQFGHVVEDPAAGDRRVHHPVRAVVDAVGVSFNDPIDDLHRDRTVRGGA